MRAAAAQRCHGYAAACGIEIWRRPRAQVLQSRGNARRRGENDDGCGVGRMVRACRLLFILPLVAGGRQTLVTALVLPFLRKLLGARSNRAQSRAPDGIEVCSIEDCHKRYRHRALMSVSHNRFGLTLK